MWEIEKRVIKEDCKQEHLAKKDVRERERWNYHFCVRRMSMREGKMEGKNNGGRKERRGEM